MSDITVDELVEKIDARGIRWDLYRGAHVDEATNKQVWVVALRDDDQVELTHRSVSLIEALRWAAEVELLPVVPRRPTVTTHWEVRKAGPGKWHVYTDGHLQREFGTKTAAERAIGQAAARERERDDGWLTQWGHLVTTGTEGVDFRWRQ